MCDIKNATYYQELTLEALGKILEAEARIGHSKWYCSNYNIGQSMKDLLESKGFSVNGYCNTYQNISW